MHTNAYKGVGGKLMIDKASCSVVFEVSEVFDIYFILYSI